MGLSRPEYDSLYGQYKQAEGDVLQWIRSVSEPSASGTQHCYSYHKVLAEKASSTGRTMPERVQDKTKLAFLNRIRIAEDHLERGESCEKHEFSIEMLRTFIKCFLPSAEAEGLVKRSSTNFSSTSSQSSRSSSPAQSLRSNSPSTEQPYPQPVVNSWRTRPQQVQYNYHTTTPCFGQGVFPMVQQMSYNPQLLEQSWRPLGPPPPLAFGQFSQYYTGAPVQAQGGCTYYM